MVLQCISAAAALVEAAEVGKYIIISDIDGGKIEFRCLYIPTEVQSSRYYPACIRKLCFHINFVPSRLIYNNHETFWIRIWAPRISPFQPLCIFLLTQNFVHSWIWKIFWFVKTYWERIRLFVALFSSIPCPSVTFPEMLLELRLHYRICGAGIWNSFLLAGP